MEFNPVIAYKTPSNQVYCISCIDIVVEEQDLGEDEITSLYFDDINPNMTCSECDELLLG
jgi:hypothetical protein